jgi:uncharacterized protein (DUF1501 family)
MMNPTMKRRDLLKWLAAIGPQTGVGLTSLTAMSHLAAQTATDTKFLVCLYMRGGNDQSNFIVPRSGSAYTSYQSGRSNIALSSASTLALSPTGFSGPSLGLHPNLPFLAGLFNQGKAALLANVGNLVGPISKAQWNAGAATAAIPAQLFSHNDQENQWATAIPSGTGKTGWLGRMADIIGDTYNSSSSVSMNISAGRQSFSLAGQKVIPYQITPNGSTPLFPVQNGVWGSGNAITALRNFYARTNGNLLEQEVGKVLTRSINANSQLTTAIKGAAFNGSFPSTALGQQLQGVAKVMQVAGSLSKRRMVFNVDIENFDFHENLLPRQAERLTEVNGAIEAFYNFLQTNGLLDKTVVFSASDFGRALQSNSKGSDHGWGSHHFIFGGPVVGQRIYGSFPTVALDGPEDAGQGRLIPTTSFDQYAATLATWFGVSSTNIASVVPNIGNFSTANLGFLA